MSTMKIPGTRVRVGVGVRVCVGVGRVPVTVGVREAVGVIVIVPVTVGVFIASSLRMIGRYVVDCSEARAMITKPIARTKARSHFSRGEETCFGGVPLIETY